MTDTLVPTETQTVPQADGGDHDRYAHIIRKPGGDGGAAVLQAGLLGEELEALCGKRWIPQRDPAKFPVCPTCKEVRAQMKGEV